MKTMKRFEVMTRVMMACGMLAAVGCSAEPGTTTGGTGDGTHGGVGGAGTGAGNGAGGSSGGGLFGHADAGAGTPSNGGATPADFCNGLDAWLTKCGSAPAQGGEAQCEQSYQKYTSAQIGASVSCLSAQTSCDQGALQQCLSQAVSASTGTGTGAADAGGGTNACDQCANAQCAAQIKGCEANPDCVTLYQCMSNAQTQQDAQNCENQTPNGVTDLQALAQCISGPCASACK